MPPGISYVLALLLLVEVGVTEGSYIKDHCKLYCNVAHSGADWMEEEKYKLCQDRSNLLDAMAKVEGDLQNLEKPMTIGIIGNEVWRSKFILFLENRLKSINRKISLVNYKVRKIEETQKMLKNRENKK